jgi:Immunity protein Imm5
MMLSEQIQTLLTQYKETIANNTNHKFTATNRYNLYKSFGNSRLNSPEFDWSGDEVLEFGMKYDQFLAEEWKNYTFADHVLIWFAIVTAKKVIVACKTIEGQPVKRDNIIKEAEEILNLAENTLKQKNSFEETKYLLENKYWFFYDDDLPYNISSTYKAAVMVLHILIHSARELATTDYDDEEIGIIRGDFAFEAVKAYTAVDKNYESVPLLRNRSSLIKFDPEKRLEFWTWWLTEAIPQAWELAHTTYRLPS